MWIVMLVWQKIEYYKYSIYPLLSLLLNTLYTHRHCHKRNFTPYAQIPTNVAPVVFIQTEFKTSRLLCQHMYLSKELTIQRNGSQ